jgi:hypothetical protein
MFRRLQVNRIGGAFCGICDNEALGAIIRELDGYQNQHVVNLSRSERQNAMPHDVNYS